MKGRLRIRDRTAEREIDLARGTVYIHSSESETVTVENEAPAQSGLSLHWDGRHATWVLRVALALSLPAMINGRPVDPGEEIPLSNLDRIELPGAVIQFQRVLAAPTRAGAPAGRVALDSAPLV